MDFEFTEAQHQLRAEIRDFLDAELPAGWVGIWHQDTAPAVSDEVTRKMADCGWLTYYWPTEFGGRAGNAWDQAVIQEELFAYHEPRGGQYMGVNWIGPALMRYGSDAQKARYLPEIAQGRVQWAQLFSEPDAGSDLAALRTSAIFDAERGDFVVNGEKIWTSYANLARRGFLLARTDQGAAKHAGISAFLIDMSWPGIEVREILSSVGNHRFHSVSLTDVRVPADALLGPLNGGWSVAMSSLPFERAGNARYARITRCLGFLERSAGEQELPVSESVQVRGRIIDALAIGRMTELLNHAVVAMKDRDEVPGWEASAAFAANALYEKDVADLLEDAYGYTAFVAVDDERAPAGGEIESFAARQAPTVKIQAGTYEMQLSLIAQQGLGLPRGR
jgi:alkylation response protein AidB-like acyl-CoA dehydrogenase